ncbi:predicted protein [Aspergillus terreus NIH2624]|uniref:Uncharacterized protein n=1 Tax=Aspergillus terreus (strain NIH 2624 / FGSC A1156) TaxID=341663 RepID=Q0CB68_ASPTN|nr:uncharacterized protein ATEG_09066 [Aspergillus terreus NIH2624]EAU30203.1 predicted protein [Aspergillus terreus NIH2624]
MQFLWTAALIVGCLGAPLTPPFSKVAESMEGMTQTPMGSVDLALTERDRRVCSSLLYVPRPNPTNALDMMITDSVPWIEQCMIKLPILHGRAILTSAGHCGMYPSVCLNKSELAPLTQASSAFQNNNVLTMLMSLQSLMSAFCVSSFFRQCYTLRGSSRVPVTDQSQRESPTMTTDGDVNPTNDGTVNNNVSFLRFC